MRVDHLDTAKWGIHEVPMFLIATTTSDKLQCQYISCLLSKLFEY